MKKLYLLRHADAAAKEDYDNDLERPLTDEGIDQTTGTAHKARAVRLKFDLIVTSPAVRAAQTAEILANALRMSDRVVKDPRLLPGATLEKMKKIIQEYGGKTSIVCVGHEPDLGVIAGALLGLSQPRPLKKAEMIEVALNNAR